MDAAREPGRTEERSAENGAHAAEEAASYWLHKRHPLNAGDVEDARAWWTEVVVRWGDALVHVAHVPAGRAFALVADEGAAREGERFVVPQEVLGGASGWTLVPGEGAACVMVPQGLAACARVDGEEVSLEALLASGRAVRAAGSIEIALRGDIRVVLTVGAFTVALRAVPRGRRVARKQRKDAALVGSLAAACVAVATVLPVVQAAARTNPLLVDEGAEEHLAHLSALAARVRPTVVREGSGNAGYDPGDAPVFSGTGTAHTGAAGAMGRRDVATQRARYAIPNRAMAPHLAAERGTNLVADRGVFVALRSDLTGPGGSASGIVSPFGALTESGHDVDAAAGHMTGNRVGDAAGFEGLGAIGTGWGGGGTGEGTAGLGALGVIGHGAGVGSGQGYGSGAGRGLHGRDSYGWAIGPCGCNMTCTPRVEGGLSPEAIRRVVRRNLGQVAHCHEQGMMQDPDVAGRVLVRFVIDGDGGVMGSRVVESNVSVPAVSECIARAVRRWQFPAPAGGGIVTVNYPFDLERAQ